MKELSTYDRSIASLIRIVILTQLIAYLWRGITIAIEDAPDIFLQVKVWSFVIPIVLIILLFVLNLDKRLAQLNAGRLFIFLSLVVSVSTTVIAIIELMYHLDVPEYLLTPTRKYWQTISIVTLAIYLLALTLTTYFSVRALRNSLNNTQTE
jgi:hypothetical protein